jgi:hypothetical protein
MEAEQVLENDRVAPSLLRRCTRQVVDGRLVASVANLTSERTKLAILPLAANVQSHHIGIRFQESGKPQPFMSSQNT